MSGEEPIRVLSVGGDRAVADHLERATDPFAVRCRHEPAAISSVLEDWGPDCLVVAGDGLDDPLGAFERARDAGFDGPTLLYGGTETLVTEALDAGVTDVVREVGDASPAVLANRVTNAVACARARQTAQQRERRLEVLLESSAERLSVLDEEGRYRFVSPAFERLLGYDREELRGTSGFEYVHPEDRERVRERFAALRERPGETDTVQYRVRDADGEYRLVESTGTNRLDEPAIDGIVLNSREITEQAQRQQQLDHSRSLLEAVVQTDLEGTVVIDDERNIVLYNERFRELWDIPEEVLARRSDEAAIGYVLDDLENPEEFRETVEYLYDHPEQQRRDVVHLSDGRVFERYTDSVTGEDGTYYGRLWSFRDITERVEREQELAAEQALTDAVFAALPDVFYAFDQHGNFSRWNDRLEEVTGYSAEEIESMEPADFIVAEDRETVFEAVTEVFEEDRTVTVEARFETKGGEVIPYEFTGAKMTDEDGETLGLVGIGRDISDRKRRQRRFEAVFNNTYQFTGLMEPDGTLVEANETALAFGGMDREDVVGEKVWNAGWFQHSAEAADIAREAVEQAREGTLYRNEVTVAGAEDTEIIDFSVRPIVDERGEVQLLIPEGRTITELKHREQHLGVLHRFLRHNLRNKMTVIEGTAGLLADKLEDTEYVDHVEQIRGAAAELVELSETAHQLSQVAIEASTQRQPTDLGQILQSVEREIRQGYPEAVVRLPREVDLQVSADWRLSVVFEQLVENAIEHNDSETPTVDVAIEATEETVTVSITDDGPGIPEDELAGITTDEEQTQLTHGTGFGLWLVRSVVEDYGGDLSYETAPDGGSTLLVTLQRVADPETPTDGVRERSNS